MPSQVIRPSHFRRKKIWDPSIDPSLNFNVSSIFLISKYYNVIEIIQVTFYKAYLSGELDQAYIWETICDYGHVFNSEARILFIPSSFGR